MPHTVRKRIRKTPEERRQEIREVAVRLVSEHGFNGISLKDVADEIGMSQPGLLHYVGDRDGLLSLLVTDVYDTSGTPEEFIGSGLLGSDKDDLHFPAYLRYLVECNSKRRMMVQLFIVLEGESFDAKHPLHDFFLHRPDNVWKHYSQFPWALPDRYRPWAENMRPVVEQCLEVIDGLQLRWLREPEIDMNAKWLEFESILFPDEIWHGYR